MSAREKLGYPPYTQMSLERRREFDRRRAALFRAEHPDRARAINRRFKARHREKVAAALKSWRQKNRDRCLAYDAARHKEEYRDPIKRAEICRRVREYVRRKEQEDPAFRARRVQQSRLAGLVRGTTFKPTSATYSYSAAELRETMERKFQPGMTWENYGRGKGKWHIDHVVPCSAFDLTKPAEVRKCFALSNLQPMWGRQNIQKSDKTMKQALLPI